MRYFSTLFITLLTAAASLFAGAREDFPKFHDLERFPTDFVLDIKKIEIPGHPYAFNPSLVRRNGNLLLSFREIVGPCSSSIVSSGESIIGLVWLNDDFSPASEPCILDFESLPTLAEDARLVEVGNDLYIVYSANVNEVVTDSGFRMWIAKLVYEGGKFTLTHKQQLSQFPEENPERREKNWIPFDFYGYLCLSYSISPHRVFLPLEETHRCYTIGETKANIHWRWGDLRGGTPAVIIDDRYLSFFHSWIDMSSLQSAGEITSHYFIGAYTFSKYPPFEITHISPKPIVAKGFYSGENYPYFWKPISAVFPCGILVEKNAVWMTYGRQDHEIWVAKMDKKRLLQSLIPVDYYPSR